MATPLPVAVFFVASLFFFSLSSSASPILRSDSGKVSLALYYESLCPYSANFIVNYLNEAVQDDELMSVVDLYLSPWGNAKLKGNDTFTCQHGPAECLFNTVEACAIHVWPDLKKHFPFIYCIEKLVYEHNSSQWESCFEELDLDSKPIAECISSGCGKELELQYAAETNALQPPHQYVPWVVVDDQPLYEDCENFLSYVCNAYKGTSALKLCSKISHPTIRRGKWHAIVPVCRKETMISTLSKKIKSVISWWMQLMDGTASA